MRLGAMRLIGGRTERRKDGTDLDRPTVRPPDRRGSGGSGRLPVLDERLRGTKFVELPVQSAANSPESTGMGFWSINPYVGCEFGCSYCYARYAHRYVVERARDGGRITQHEFHDLRRPVGLEGFEHRIFVKSRQAVLAALARDLPRIRRRTARDGPQSIVIGTATDPYQPAERQYQITRAVLGRLRDERGFRIGIITKSPLVCRDTGLLRQLARQHWLSVYISLVSADIRVIKLFEARSPMPHTRLKALEELTSAGVRAGVIVAPILPGITDSQWQIDQLVRAAKQAGAQFVYPSPLRLYPAVRQRFLPIVERHFPKLAQRYRAAYDDKCNAPQKYIAAVTRRFQRIARKYGIPETDAEKEQPRGQGEGSAMQLSFWQ